jgi:poly(glycerol-phosphate) alpha-glucosyltransferase
MNVAFLLASTSRKGAGVTEVARALANSLKSATDVCVRAYGLTDNYTAMDAAGWAPLQVQTRATIGPRSFGYAPGLLGLVMHSGAEVLHSHGLWMYTSLLSRKAMSAGIPGVISPHGMLDPWALRNSRWKKTLARLLFEDSHLRRAGCLHALASAELTAIRALGLTGPVCVIPNGISLPAMGEPETPQATGPRRSTPTHRLLLHLGRIHPKKGLTNLLEAWARVKRRRASGADEWRLAIAGWESDSSTYERELRSRAAALGIEDSVSFPGPLYDAAKDAMLRDADAFVLASLSEGMPMAVLEAWSYRLPVIMTPECNLPEGFMAGAALKTETAVDALETGLADLFAMSDAERVQMGRAGRRLVQDRFNWDRTGQDFRAVYHWLVGGGPRPPCVDPGRPR